ncbi:MAG: LPS-assembly protein LptD [Chthoniobacterales bacterium]
MRKLVWLLSVLLAARIGSAAEVEPSTLKGQPVEITASGNTNYVNGVATARDNVAIHVGDTDIYADYAEYDPQSHQIRVRGNVRIYRDITLYIGDSATYNTETKEVTAHTMRTAHEAYFVKGDNVTSIGEGAFRVTDGDMTTHDSSHPDFHLRARTVRVYEQDRVIFQNVTFYVGQVPVFWWPYLYQSLDNEFSFLVSPAYLSSWGVSLLGHITFPITDNMVGTLRLDYRERRGVAIGFDSTLRYGKDKRSVARLRTYFLQDQNPQIDRTTTDNREKLGAGRYRVSLQDKTIFSDDIYAIADVTKLSDPFVLEDFYQSEFRVDPQPDDMVAVAKTNPFYTLTAISRFQANDFFTTTERLPEIALDIKRHAIFGSPIFYEGETTTANLHLAYPDDSDLHGYSSWRLDTFHQLSYPNTYFGWLSIVPRVGIRGTYYSETRDLGQTLFPGDVPLFAGLDTPFTPNFTRINPAAPVVDGGDKFRGVLNAGAEASFKLSRTWESVQSRLFGLDGLRHIIQPFTNYSFVGTTGASTEEILQFDRFQPTTQLPPITFPQFTSVDSIDNWSIWRVGVRNTLQTRRDDSTINWMGLETYLDVNFDSPFDKTAYSNVFNNFFFSPVPWASLIINSQTPLLDKGYTEVNTGITIQPIPALSVSIAHRYLNQYPFFPNSSLYDFGGYYRINDNWGVGVSEQYEGATGVLEQQRYSIYRDLTSWVASLGAVVRDNGGVKEYGVLLTFTLKALPKFSFDLNVDPQGAGENQ